MQVCVCVCMYACARCCICVCVCVCTYIYLYKYRYAHTYTHIYIFTLEKIKYFFHEYIYIYIYIGWNDKIVVPKKTTLQIYFKTFFEKGTVREGYKVVALLLKLSLGLFRLVGRRRVLLPHPGPATGHVIAPGDHRTLQHLQVHFGVDFQADFEDVRWHDVALSWNHTKDHNRSRKLCFHHPGHVPIIRGNPDLHFEGAGNGPVVITWIGREQELYSDVSPI